MQHLKVVCISLAVCINLLLFPLAVGAQDNTPMVGVEVSSDTLTVGVPWVLLLVVDHGIPDEVTVMAPPFAGALFLDRYVKMPMIVGAQIRTAIEYTLIPNRAGWVRIEPFTVRTPVGEAETSAMVFNIRGSGAERRLVSPRLVWEEASGQAAGQSLTAGERAVFALRVTGLAPSLLPPQEFFMPEVPQGAILTLSPLSAEEREGGLAIRLALIPLEGDFLLPARVLQHGNNVFEIPALHIRVSGHPENTSRRGIEPMGREAQGEGKTEEASLIYPQFPDFDFTVFDKSVLGKIWRKQCEETYRISQELWYNDNRAQALAELRHKERNHPAGALLQPIRREAEESLGIFNTGNESRGLQKLLSGLVLIFFILVIIAPLVCYKMIGRKAALACIVIFAVLGFVCLYRLVDLRGISGKNGRFGVTNETIVRRMADYDGGELFSFREGQPVMVMLNSGSWLYVRTNDDKNNAGWIPAETIIFY